MATGLNASLGKLFVAVDPSRNRVAVPPELQNQFWAVGGYVDTRPVPLGVVETVLQPGADKVLAGFVLLHRRETGEPISGVARPVALGVLLIAAGQKTFPGLVLVTVDDYFALGVLDIDAVLFVRGPVPPLDRVTLELRRVLDIVLDLPAVFLVGLFQGARYLSTGMYRPGYSCIMRILGAPYCQVPGQA